MAEKNQLGALMSADLASLLFLVLLALVTEVSFGTPDPAREFLMEVGKCLEFDQFQNASCDQRIVDSMEMSQRTLGGKPSYSLCASRGPAEYVDLFDENCEGERQVELDFDERVIRLPATFEFDEVAPEPNSREAVFLDHVASVVALAVKIQKEDERQQRQFAGHRGLSNVFFDLAIVEGHSDHIVERYIDSEKAPGLGKTPFDDNVKLAMTRARYVASQLQSWDETEQIEVLVASLGCHRPLTPIGPLGDDNDARPKFRHDRACFKVMPDEETPGDPRQHIRPATVNRDAVGSFVEAPSFTGKEELKDFTAANRRVEIRVLFRVGEE